MVDWLGKWTVGEYPDPLKGALAGAAGGFVGTLRMGRVSTMWNKVNRKLEQAESDRLQPMTRRRGEDEDSLPPFGDRTQDQAQQSVAAAVIRALRHRPAQPGERDLGGEIVHQVTGVLAGAAYGIACEYSPALRKSHGLVLGVTLYLLGRQAALPLSGLAPRPTKQPPADHLLSLVSHLAYGVFCEIVRAKLRQTMKAK